MQKPSIPESSIQSGIKTILLLDGWRVFETDKQRRHAETGSLRHPLSEPGMPDLLCLRYCPPIAASYLGFKSDASVLWVECKKLSAKPDKHQKLWHAAERERGAMVCVLGEDCPATIDGWQTWYRVNGLSKKGAL